MRWRLPLPKWLSQDRWRPPVEEPTPPPPPPPPAPPSPPAPRLWTTQAGKDLIKEYESLRLTAYRDPRGILTIGWGHTGGDVYPGLTITKEKAEYLFVLDLDEHERAVRRLVNDATPEQFSALVSFAYNLGPEKLARSTLLKKHNAGDYAGAAEQFGRWVYAQINGRFVKLRGLIRRRAAEAALYQSKGSGHGS